MQHHAVSLCTAYKVGLIRQCSVYSTTATMIPWPQVHDKLRRRIILAAAAPERSRTDRQAQSCSSLRGSVLERRQVAIGRRCRVCGRQNMLMSLWRLADACPVNYRVKRPGRERNQPAQCQTDCNVHRLQPLQICT